MINTTLINEKMGAKRLTNKKFAELIGVTPATISYLRNGRTNPDTQTLKKAAEVLEVSVDDLLKAAA